MIKPRQLPTLRVLVFLLLVSSAAPVPHALAQSGAGGGGKATTPPQGSPERKAVLDAVRVRLQLKSQFKVYHLKLNGNWAYFHG
jgi:hypothetical protein